MKYDVFQFSVLVMLLFTVALPVRVDAAAAPHKAVFTFGGLNERSGVLFVARDAGIIQKHGVDATVVNVHNAQAGCRPAKLDRITPVVVHVLSARSNTNPS